MTAKESGRFGKWKIVRDLPGGGQSYTHLVRERGNAAGARFVLKRLKNVKRIDRFARELQTCKQLSHPNVVAVVDSDLVAKEPYIVTEYCTGGCLDAAIQRLLTKTSLEKLGLFHSICLGVGNAHAAGIIHRDLKPANIFLQADDSPVVGDWGLCFLLDTELRVTPSGEAVGPRNYMAPELEDGRAEEVRASADVYSLGKVLYFLFAGRSFAREKHRDPAFDITPTNVALAAVYRLLDKMIVFEPRGRLQDATQVADAVLDTIHYLGSRSKALNPVNARDVDGRIKIIRFPPYAPAETKSLSSGRRQPLGFRVSGPSAALWGVAHLGSAAAVILARTLSGEWSESRIASEYGFQAPQGSYDRSLSFGVDGTASLLLAERQSAPAGSVSLSLFLVAGTEVSRQLVASDVTVPRSLTLAISPNGLKAVYVGASDEKEARLSFMAEQPRITYHSRKRPIFQALVFDNADTLHHAVVSSRVEANQEIRDLYYSSRTRDGVWKHILVDSVSGSPASAHIDLATSPTGNPVILTNWSSVADSLAIYEMRNAEFSKRIVSIGPVLETYALLPSDLGGEKRVIFGSDGVAHITLSATSHETKDCIYLGVAPDCEVNSSRDVILDQFLGMGLDQTGTLCLAVL